MWGRAVLLLLAGLGFSAATLVSAAPAGAAGVVGNGSPASCTEAELNTRLMGGGMVTFSCGPAPHEIVLTSQKGIMASTFIDGDDRITLSGGDTTRLFVVFGGVTFTLNQITITRGFSSATNGGAVTSGGTVNVTNSRILNNRTTANRRGGAIAGGGTLNIIDSEVANNEAGDAGAIYMVPGQVTITNSAVHDNHAIANLPFPPGVGGVIWVGSGGDVTINGGDLYNNTSVADGGVLYSTSAGSVITVQGGAQLRNNSSSGERGGAIAWGGTGVLNNVTLSGNSAVQGGAIFANGTMTLTNVTLSGNSATLEGGALINRFGTSSLTNVTLSGNVAPTGGAIFQDQIADPASLIRLNSTILANSGPGGNCGKDATTSGTITSSGFNLSDDPTCAPYLNPVFGDLNDTPAGLGPLANNGGTTQTHLLMPGSPAIDHGPCFFGSDQRGLPRPDPGGTLCDAGSVEMQPGELPTPTPTRTPTITPTPTRTPTITTTPTATVPGVPTATPTSPTVSTSTPEPTSTTGPAPGAHGFSLLTNPSGPVLAQARWTPGTGQNGFKGYRVAPSSGAVTSFPSGAGLLPHDASSFDDPAPGGMGCYFAGVLGGNPPGAISYGISDVICLYRGLASGATPPNFKAQLNGPLVILSWAAPGGQTGYTVDILRFDGTAPTSENLGAGATSTFHNTGGAIVCFRVRTMGVAGQTDVLCPMANSGTPGVAGATARDPLRFQLEVARPGTPFVPR